MTWLDVVIMILATNQAVETFHHGSLFAESRAKLEISEGFFAELLLCPFCLSHWVAALTVGWYVVARWLVGETWELLALAPVYALAIARGAQLLNDVAHRRLRTPRVGFSESEDGDAQAGGLSSTSHSRE